jgi:ABC-type multidrug transport system fused ATPase/permease subunit
VLVGAILGVANPLLIKVVFDEALLPSSGCPDVSLLVTLSVIMLLIAIVSAALGVYQAVLTNGLGQRDLRDRVHRHLHSLSLSFYATARTGELQSRISNDEGRVQTAVLIYLAAGLPINGGTATTAGTIIAFTTRQNRLLFPVARLLETFVEFQASQSMFERIFEYLDPKPDVTEANDPVVLEPDVCRGRVRLQRRSLRVPRHRRSPEQGARRNRLQGVVRTTDRLRRNVRCRQPTPSMSSNTGRSSRAAPMTSFSLAAAPIASSATTSPPDGKIETRCSDGFVMSDGRSRARPACSSVGLGARGAPPPQRASAKGYLPPRRA